MRREGNTIRRRGAAILFGSLLCGMGSAASFAQGTAGTDGGARRGAEVSGIVRMPEICSPSVSPAVIYLVPVAARGRIVGMKPVAASRGEIALVDQQGLQFTPRVQAIVFGQSVRFGNKDSESHNVHVVTPGFAFNQSMAPGNSVDYTPDRPGVMQLACDIHSHMRGFVVVSPTPWVQVCSRPGQFRLENVPDGRYDLNVWHELGEPFRQEIVVAGGKALVLPELVLNGPSNPVRMAGTAMPPRLWSEVIDRIGVILAESRVAATRAGELAKARRLADDAYFAEFEASDMETALRRHLGYSRAGKIEQQFREYRSAIRDVVEHRRPATDLDDLSHKLLRDLLSAARELDIKGVTDRSRMAAFGTATVDAGPAASATGGPREDPKALLQALRGGFRRIGQEAQQNGPDEAASEMATVYMTEFEPLERYLMGRGQQSKPLEVQFNSLRGDLFAGLKGTELTDRLDRLYSEVETLVTRLEARPAGTFGTAFFESFVTIVREGVEVILVLAMLIALVTKATPAGTKTNASTVPSLDQTRARGKALRAIWWGVAMAVIASLATAAALNLLVSSMQGRAREINEGLVMLVAAGVLFYVSYWLVSQAETKRWMDFLKNQARRGLEWGGQGTLAVTAFLAVYREGAETSLMYQALLGSQGQTRPGLLGLSSGFVVGLAILAAIAVLVRATSVRLPLRTFFKFTGLFLFALAVVFAGNGVFELQNAGILITTHLAWMGNGLPMAGIYPNLQAISVQGLLVLGALLAWAVIPRADLADTKTGPPSTGTGTTTAATTKPLARETGHASALDGSDRRLADPGRSGPDPGDEPGPEGSECSAARPSEATPRDLAASPPPSGPDTEKGTQTPAGFREYPIGEEVERNQMRIAAVWLPSVQMDAMSGPLPSDLIHLEADIHATEGNRNGFPKDAFIFGLVVQYTIVPVDADRKSDPPIAGVLTPMLACDGEHYGANILMPRAGHYNLTYAIKPPSATGVGLHRDPATGVDPWWTPFEVSFDWDYAGPPK